MPINKPIPIIRGVKVIYFEAELFLFLLLIQVLIFAFLSVLVSSCVMDDVHASKMAQVLLDVSEGWCILQKVMTSGLEVTDPLTSCPHNNFSSSDLEQHPPFLTHVPRSIFKEQARHNVVVTEGQICAALRQLLKLLRVISSPL